MTAMADRVPVDELKGRARQVRPGRVALIVIGAIGTAIGWAVAKFFLSAGWLAGRAWLTGAYFAEAVIYGFRAGAKLPVVPPPPEDDQQVKTPG